MGDDRAPKSCLILYIGPPRLFGECKSELGRIAQRQAENMRVALSFPLCGYEHEVGSKNTTGISSNHVNPVLP